MKFILNDNEIAIKALSDCEIVKTSPLTSLEVKGEYALSFELPATPELQKALGYPHLRNISSAPSSFTSMILDGNILLYAGTGNIKNAARQYYSVDLSTAPGNIPLSLWTQKLAKFDFGNDVIATNNANTIFYKLNIYDVIGTRTSSSTLYSLSDYIGSNFTTFQLFINTDKVIEKDFYYSASAVYDGTDFIQEMIDAYNDAPSSLYPNSKIERYETEWVVRVPDGNFTVTAKIIVHPLPTGGVGRPRPGSGEFTITYNFTRLTYPSLNGYFNNALGNAWTKPYELPTIYAPNFYGEGNGNFNGYINLKQGSSFFYSSDTDLNIYTFCPAFRLQWVFEKLCQLFGYTVDSSFWTNSVWKDVLWLTLVSTDKQHPSTSKPFLLHNNIITYADYLPDWTAQEFINYLQDFMNVMVDFNSMTKVVSIRNRTINLSTAKKINIDSYITEGPNNPTVQQKYAFKWNITNSDEPSFENTKFEERTLDGEDNVTNITIAFVPMVQQSEYSEVDSSNPQRFNPLGSYQSSWDWSYNGGSNIINPSAPSGELSVWQSGRSAMFDLSKEDIKSRVLFYSRTGSTQTMSNEKSGQSLFIQGDNGLYKKLWESYIKQFQNTIECNVSCILPRQVLYEIQWDTVLLADNVPWVLHEVKINPDSQKTAMLIRRISQ